VIFALDEHEELDAKRGEANRDVDPIPPVVRNYQLLLFEPEVVQPSTKAAKHVSDEHFELLAVNARPVISRGSLGVTQPKVSALRHYKLAGFSVERLMNLLTALDQDVEIVIRRKPRSRKSARVSVVAV
jgi:hypothetical protein